jgi:hypothetical protein
MKLFALLWHMVSDFKLIALERRVTNEIAGSHQIIPL